LLYFVAVAQFGVTVLTAPLVVQMDEMTYRNVSRTIMVKRYPALTQSATEGQRARQAAMRVSLTARYDGATESVAKLIVVVLIPFYALTLAVLYVGTRRYFAEHLTFATHLVAIFLLAIPASGLALAGFLRALALAGVRPDPGELPYVLFLTLWIGAYAYAAQRVVYGSGRLVTLLRTTLLVGTLLPIIVAFKFVLFLTTLYWIA
jgi:hypothetical protein